ncbi:hypothetical protein [Bradyrhizobium sp.]|uniref:hypothetical protein n=1 Tax=Bradyrhizobium sp. TaxID=376 RepID=UPI003C61D993
MLAPVVLGFVLMTVIVVSVEIVIGTETVIFDAVGVRSLSFNQAGTVTPTGITDVITITKIAIE